MTKFVAKGSICRISFNKPLLSMYQGKDGRNGASGNCFRRSFHRTLFTPSFNGFEPCNRNISNSSNVRCIDTQCFQLLQLLIYQSRHLGNDLGQVTGTELQMLSVGSFVNICAKKSADAKPTPRQIVTWFSLRED